MDFPYIFCSSSLIIIHILCKKLILIFIVKEKKEEVKKTNFCRRVRKAVAIFYADESVFRNMLWSTFLRSGGSPSPPHHFGLLYVFSRLPQ